MRSQLGRRSAADASFDIVFCDHGAMNFADPYRTVPEVARLLRPGGLFTFCHLSPIQDPCWPDDADRAGDRLVRANGFEVLDLIEPRPAPDAVSSYRDDEERAWARRWPAECIWRLRRS